MGRRFRGSGKLILGWAIVLLLINLLLFSLIASRVEKKQEEIHATLQTVIFPNLDFISRLMLLASPLNDCLANYCRPAYSNCVQTLCQPLVSGCAIPCITLYNPDSLDSKCRGGCIDYAKNVECAKPYMSGFMGCLAGCLYSTERGKCGNDCIATLESNMENCQVPPTTTSPPTTPPQTTLPMGLEVSIQTYDERGIPKESFNVGDAFYCKITVRGETGPIRGADLEISFSSEGTSTPYRGITNDEGQFILNWNWEETHVGAWLIEAIASKQGYMKKSNSKTITVNSYSEQSLKVHLETDKANYNVGEPIFCKATITDQAGKYISSAHVEIEYIHIESGKKSKAEGWTGENGQLSWNWVWEETQVGVWTIGVTASKEGYKNGGDAKTIIVGQSPIIIELKCDKCDKDNIGIYIAGQRVILSGSIKKLVNGKYVSYGSSMPFSIIIKFPDGQEGKPFHVNTENDGSFKFIPFAPYKLTDPFVTGVPPYYITAKLNPKDFIRDFPTLNPEIWPSSTATIRVQHPNSPDTEQFKKIIDLFKDPNKGVPSNQKYVKSRYEYRHLDVPLGEIGEMDYGWWNNFFKFGGFNCVGYEIKTLRFLNKLRFSDEEPYASNRGLLEGIDYGPIARGSIDAYSALISGEHHAVVLYDRYYDWNDDENYVLDPWPKQEPETFTVKEFKRFYGSLSPYAYTLLGIFPCPHWDYAGDRLLNAFPNLGGMVYWNLDWLKSLDPENKIGWSYREDPDLGLKSEIKQAKKGLFWWLGCPAVIDISNNKGKHIGLSEDGKLVAEIPESELFIYPKSGNDVVWYIWLPEGEYHARIRGLGNGDFHLLTSKGDDVVYFYKASIEKEGIATLEVNGKGLGEPLILPDGKKVSPIELPPENVETHDVYYYLLIFIFLLFLILLYIFTRKIISASRSKKKEPMVIQKYVSCEKCGRQIREGSTYCIYCGDRQDTGKIAFCEECGRQIPANSTYCPYCRDKQGDHK